MRASALVTHTERGSIGKNHFISLVKTLDENRPPDVGADGRERKGKPACPSGGAVSHEPSQKRGSRSDSVITGRRLVLETTHGTGP